MRELTVRIRFTRHCLGNERLRNGKYVFQRAPDGAVLFMPSWHKSNMRMAAELLGRHQGATDKILWDASVECSDVRWHRRYFRAGNGLPRFAQHEAFFPGQVVGLNCVVSTDISDDDFLQLMRLAGRFKGLSPWNPGEFGQFEVDRITPRRGPATPCDGEPVKEATTSVSDEKQSNDNERVEQKTEASRSG